MIDIASMATPGMYDHPAPLQTALRKLRHGNPGESLVQASEGDTNIRMVCRAAGYIMVSTEKCTALWVYVSAIC